MNALMSIPFEFDCASIYDIVEVNSTFAVGTLKVMYLGDNRNGSRFSKEAVKKALPSLKNVPIVCHWDEDEGVIGGHDMTVVSDEDGNMRLKNLTEPCGVVPDHAEVFFQKDTDENGDEHEYLVIKGVILWKRQDVYRHIVDDLDGKVKHSMEVHVKKGDIIDGIYDISDFEFTALCLLEKYEPCFQGSELELFSTEHFKQKMEQMMLEIKESFKQVITSDEVDNIHPQIFSTEGGEKVLEEKQKVLADYGIDAETLDFSIEDYTVEELIEKFDEMKNEGSSEGEQTIEEPAATGEQDQYTLTGNIVEELRRVLGQEMVQREWGECPRYWYVDCDFDLHEVYCYDTTDWLLYGFTYTTDGDSISVDYDSKKRVKFVIADFDGGEQESPFASAFALLEERISENKDWESKYQNASDTIASMETELGELRQYRNDTETAIAKKEREAVFEKFEDLVGVEAFEELKEHCMEYDAYTLEEKCFAIRGRIGVANKYSYESKAPKIVVDKASRTAEPYGGIMVKYGVATN